MKQRKIAISLTIVGVIAALFVFHTYKARPITHGLISLTAEEKATIAAELKETNNCQTHHGRLNEALRDVVEPNKKTELLLRNDDVGREYFCQEGQRRLERGGDFKEYPDTLKYLTINVATAGSAFVEVFALTYLLPALAHRYWRWLNT
jgi:hypothetical protein